MFFSAKKYFLVKIWKIFACSTRWRWGYRETLDRIQELDGTYHHTIQIEKNVTKVNLNCHSKKRNKKKKIPLLTGEEIDIDQSQTDQDSPLLWIRCDPDCFLIRQCKLKQPDYCLQYQVRYERDVIGQVEALNQLIDYPTANTVKALKETIESLEYFWRVRCHACEIMYKEWLNFC